MKYQFEDDTWLDKIKDYLHWYSLCDIFKNWIYPAYDLRNLLFHRHDRIKIPQVKAWEYTDILYFMLCANMEMIVKFIEKEQPEKYICWYKDNEGKDVGHKYGEMKDYPYLYSEYNNKYIMDIIKEIYRWWKVDYPTLLNDRDYLLSFWCDYMLGDVVFKKSENDLSSIEYDKTNLPKTLDEFEKIKDIKWNIIDKYVKNRTELLDEKHFHLDIIGNLKNHIFRQEQKYLHLCIEVRPYLWT